MYCTVGIIVEAETEPEAVANAEDVADSMLTGVEAPFEHCVSHSVDGARPTGILSVRLDNDFYARKVIEERKFTAYCFERTREKWTDTLVSLNSELNKYNPEDIVAGRCNQHRIKYLLDCVGSNRCSIHRLFDETGRAVLFDEHYEELITDTNWIVPMEAKY